MRTGGFPAEDILRFWFGDSLHSAAAIKQQSRRWFQASAAVDHEIQERFGEWLEPVAEAPVSDFDDGRRLLAAVLVLDQFPRHIFRGSARAFAFDDKAVQLVDSALENHWDRDLVPPQASFLYMPLQHAESLARQQQSVELLERLLGRAQTHEKPFVESNLSFAEQHREIIQRFGRFPHRNDALGRTSTPEEVAYLAQDGRRFGQ